MEVGEKSTRYFFNLEKKRGQEKLWYRTKTTDGKYTPNFFNQKGGMKVVLTNLQGLLLINWTITKKKRLMKTLT